MIDAFFIAGTDTEVGKTVVSKAILQALNAHGLSTIGYKPVASDSQQSSEGLRNSDALHLQETASVAVPYEEVNPYTLTLAASPHIAAKHDGVEIDFDVMSEKLAQHKNNADTVLVEGAGGWRVPTSEHELLSSWVKKEQLPVVLTVGIKLGCMSHALLTAEAIKADGLNLVGWVANRINPGTEHYADIIDTLEASLGAPKLGEIPYILNAKSRDIGKYINLEPLLGDVK